MPASSRGRATTWVQANESLRVIPWGPFSGIVSDSWGSTDALRSAVATLSRVGVDGQLPVVACDDAHSLDDSSAALIAELVTGCSARVLMTVRSGVTLPDAIGALVSDELASVIDVSVLPIGDVADIVSRVLGGNVESRTVRNLHTLTEGNALYLRELVMGEIEAGRIRFVDSRWRWTTGQSIPSGLMSIVASRLVGLGSATSVLVDVLASCAPLSSRVLRSFVDVDTLERAEAMALVRTHDDHTRGLTFELAHPLYAEVARIRMGRHRQRRLNGEIASALGADRLESGVEAADSDILRLALLQVESDRPPDPFLMTTAATVALRSADLSLAERFSRLAPADASVRPLVVLGHALSWQAKGADARAVFDRLRTSDQDVLTTVLIGRAGNSFWSLGQVDEAMSFVRQELECSADLVRRESLRATLATFTVCSGGTREGVRMAESIDGAGLPAIGRLFCSWALVAGYWLQGRDRDLDRAAARAYASSAHDESILRFGIAECHLRGLRAAGRIREAARIRAELCEDPALTGEVATAMAMAVAGLAEITCAHPASAVTLLSEALISLEPIAANGWTFTTQMDLALALALMGKAGQARKVLSRAIRDRHPAFALMREELLITEAWVAASEGWASEAERCLLEATRVSRDLGHFGSEVLGWATLAQFGDGRAAERLEELAGILGSPRSKCAALHARALSDQDAPARAAVSILYDEMGDTVAALDAAAQASYEYGRRGQRREAAGQASRAEELSKRANGAVTPALRRLESPSMLTAREREVASLAAAGRSDRDIARLLGVSVRTVEGHVYRALVKVGASKRSVLGSAVQDYPETEVSRARSTRLTR